MGWDGMGYGMGWDRTGRWDVGFGVAAKTCQPLGFERVSADAYFTTVTTVAAR
jgi:hypothetical protein